MHCLLIDDDIPTIEVLRDMIRWNDFGIMRVSQAHSVQEAKAIFAVEAPDLVICDIEMPRGTGIDMIKWVREQGYEGAFIFLTCHESFDFASTAISYNADSYLTKPLDKLKLEAALRKSVESLKRKRMLGEYRKLGLTWLKNKAFVEKSFWKDVLSGTINSRLDLIQVEIRKRDLSLSVEQGYILFLASAQRHDLDQHWDMNVFIYALSNLSSEVMFDQPGHERVITYPTDSRIYTMIVYEARENNDQLHVKAERLNRLCRQYFKCHVTCYISEERSIEELAQAKAELENMDISNLIFRGGIHYERDHFNYNTSERYTLNTRHYAALFVQKEQIQIVNQLKKELEQLTAHNKLDPATLHSIREDFLQVVYSFLAGNQIQAHKLFSDDVAQRLYQRSDGSIFDFMKWAHMITEISIETTKETLRSEGVVERAKRFIHQNFNLDISREDVAACVFLTPDYLAKVFKQETGLTIKEYLNEYRIEQAKRLLIESTASISVIASNTGFDNISYFSTLFKKLTGETPNAYRANHK
ncbi:helix-turn-helix domain-containing protein [Paenibacillus sp. FSL W8-0186]|uniref:helix-turn-helix domain-containing protein n=1 Tax=Paenibacillus sp. FSL W8-0186 TaxID=2921709 RepID=UPI0030D34D83